VRFIEFRNYALIAQFYLVRGSILTALVHAAWHCVITVVAWMMSSVEIGSLTWGTTDIGHKAYAEL
jgi:hypothetical protein